MIRTLSLTLALTAGLAVAPRSGGEELVPYAHRKAVRVLTSEVARLGLADEVERLRLLLLRMGDAPTDLEKLSEHWNRNLRRGDATENQRLRTAGRVREEAGRLGALIASMDPEDGRELAEIVLALDNLQPDANQALGRTLEAGVWRSSESLARRAVQGRVETLVREARNLGFEAVHAPSRLALEDLFDGHSLNSVTVRGITAHGPLDQARLERIVVAAVQGTALSNALLGNGLQVPERIVGRQFLLLDSEEQFQLALEEAHRNHGITVGELARQSEERFATFQDHRGWVTARWRTEADFAALLLTSLVTDVLGPGAQSCLLAGHVNWLCLTLLGTSLPPELSSELSDLSSIAEADRSRHEEVLFRSAQRGLHGCRSWMIGLAARGADPPWSRSMQRHLAQIEGNALFKATIVNEHLQETEQLARLLEATRGAERPVDAFEEALGRALPEYEAEWRIWLVQADALPEDGMAQRLLGSQATAGASLETRATDLLNRLRRSARPASGPELEAVRPFPDLSLGARAHARYLELNPERLGLWPAAYEEDLRQDGYSAAGAWAGRHAVIHRASDPETALSDWMATFYHRLPLLHPGLFGVGVGSAGDVLVLDTGSLVLDPWQEHWIAWPPEGAEDVPLAYHATPPSPVPARDASEWGYPVTLQAFLPEQRNALHVELRLLRDTQEGGEPVACHVLDPRAPLFSRRVPENAWGVIPEQRLDPDTRYTVIARIRGAGSSDGERRWSFVTAR